MVVVHVVYIINNDNNPGNIPEVEQSALFQGIFMFCRLPWGYLKALGMRRWQR